MGTVRYFDNNNHIEFRGEIEDYLANTMTADQLILEYDDSVDPLPEEWPDKVEFVVENGALENWEGGPNDGQPHYTGGTLTGVNLYDATGNKVMSITGIDLSMVYVTTIIAFDSGWNAVNHILAQSHTFIGSNTAVAGDPNAGDRIMTGMGNDVVRARDGNDFMHDVGGRDVYNGGAGFDHVGYQNHRWANESASQGILARLDKGYVIGTDGLRDTLKSIEGIEGSMFDDRIIGSGQDNFIKALGGDDFINGKGGWDVVDFSGFEWLGGIGSIRANLAKGTVRDEFGSRDQVKNIEEVRGTDQNDVFRDNGKDNGFRGKDGDDTFYFGEGNDWAEGGGGADTFIYRGEDFGNDEIFDFEDGVDLLRVRNAPDYEALTIEQDGDDTLVLWNGNEIRLNDILATDITEDDFIF